ncbi:MAG: hypothetical protein IT165_06565 [Bryobacterales bacterium]|nr:hypothetical protein [Bryobacterales bacterium]
MPQLMVHYDKVTGGRRTVTVDAATGEEAIAELRHDMMLCLPEGSTPEDFEAQFRNFKFDVPSEEGGSDGVY